MRLTWILAAACLALLPATSSAQEKDDGTVEIDKKWIEAWKKKWKLTQADVDRMLEDLADSGIAKISASYARDMAADEPKARREAMAALTALAMAGPSDQEGRGAIRLLERFGALKDERAGAPSMFADIVAKLPVGRRRTAAVGAWVRAWCALENFDEARASLASARKSYGDQARLLTSLDESIRVAEARANLKLGKVAPALAGTAVDGTAIDTTAWKGDVVVVWFWARDLKSCVVRLPEMLSLSAQFEGKGVRWLGVAVDNDPAALGQFARDSGVTWPQLCEKGGWSAKPVRAWAVESAPRLWVLDRKGRVRGIDPGGRKKVAELLTTLLAEKPK